MKRRGSLFAAVSLLAASAAIAADDANPAAAGEIVVTAPTPLAVRAGDAEQHVGAADLERAHATDLTDYLRRFSGGVFVNDVQSNPLQPDINYRGFTASPLLGTPQGLSVYLDGVRLNQPFGEVVSWDLLATSAIADASIVSGANPVFGRNSLGGALVLRSKDGRSDPGVALSGSYGSFRRRTGRAQVGGSDASGLHWFVSGNHFAERGWRDHSPSRADQGFAKIGWGNAATDVALSASIADTDLNGNGLQEMRLLRADRDSVYTHPDNTRNRAYLTNLTVRHRLSSAWELSGNAFWRRIGTRTFNGDINDDALGENVYQPSAAERAALAAAGYSGVPTSGETQDNTPFPRFRCIANALLNSEPNEKCNALLNRSRNRQSEWGGSGEATLTAGPHRLVLGLSYVGSRAHFTQTSQFGYLTPDRGVVGVSGDGAFADGTQDSENAFDARVDLVGRTRAFGAYALATVGLAPTLTVDASARYDGVSVRNRDRITPTGNGTLTGNHRFDRVNPALAVHWQPGPFKVDLALAQTSRAPSAVELGCSDPANPCRLPNALAGDPPLKQVVARTGEAGIKFEQGSWRARISLFRTDSHDDILFVADDASGFGYFRNFGRTRRQGVDVTLAGRIGSVRLHGSYSFLDATYRSAEEVDGSANSSADQPAPGFEGEIDIEKGDRIPLIPRHMVKAGLSWDPTPFLSLDADMIASAGVVARGNENSGHRPDGIYYVGPGRTKSYAVLNLGAELRPIRHLTLFAQINNVFDKNYATAAQLAATGFNTAGAFVARPFAGPVIDGERPLLSSTFYAPGAPRSVQIGARLRF